MSSRGRGYGSFSSRGGYNSRGSGYRGSYRGSSSRGSYEGRGGGRGGYSYEPRFSSSSSGRYSNRDRIDDTHKKSYRPESSSYSSREYSSRTGSPDRKRLRTEGSTERRSHDGGGHYYSSRQDNYASERRSYGEDRRRSVSRERSFRKMAPPRSPPRSRAVRAPRRSFRGRSLRSRAPRSFRGSRGRGSYGSLATRRYTDKPLYARPFRSKPRSVVKEKDEASSTEEEWDPEDKEDEVVEKEVKPKSPKKEVPESLEEGGGADTEREGGDAASEEGAPVRSARPVRSAQPVRNARVSGRVALSCVHCKEKYPTFSTYTRHLMSLKHRTSMSMVARRHKMQLLRMRVAQRGAQRSLEEEAGADLATRTTFCMICRLNHRTTKPAHNATETHRAMKRFLLPFCRVCRLSFRSPMIYEHHICSLEHLKHKANQGSRKASPKPEVSGDEGMDVDLDNFMTLDSVGDVDEVDDEDSGTEKKEETAVKKPKVEINIGSEHVKKVEVYWCSLCRMFVSRVGEDEKEALRRHCRLRGHLGRYVQHRDTRTLRKHAERIHRQLHQNANQDSEKTGSVEENAEKIKVEKDESTEDNKTTENGVDSSHASDDKLWADVDKDIGEFLRDVDPQGQDGSDYEEDLGRYDKFRKSDKSVLKDSADGEEGTLVTENGEEKNDTAVEVTE